MQQKFIAISTVIMLCCASAAFGDQRVVMERNLTYGKAGEIELKLDLARPEAGDGPYPALVFIHGGGWCGGSRDGARGHIRQAAERGYVAVTVTYRLVQVDRDQDKVTDDTTDFPAAVHDCKAAVRWLRANAEKYKIDKDRIGVTGGSAGGHLSLMLGLTDDKSGLEGESGHADHSSRVHAVVNIFGPTEMASCYEKSSVQHVFRWFLDGTPEEAAATYRVASPTTYITADDPPVLTIHGDRDKLVPIQQAHLLDEKMKAAGLDHTLMLMKGQGHGFGGEHRERVEQARWDFFEKHLKP